MKYARVIPGEFVARLNRFTAVVKIGGENETVHVKNTGRLREIFVPGTRVFLCPASNPERKTRYDLISAERPDGVLFNVDSQAPNVVVREWLAKGDYDLVRPEYRYGDSRIDFYMERGVDRYLTEVKGCTLVRDGIGLFPDAPTDRGVRHLGELIRAAKEGIAASVLFVIQTNGVSEVRANEETHAEFARVLERAKTSGVEVRFLRCHVAPDEIVAVSEG